MQELLYFLLVVSIVVTVHELGHFWAARAVGVRVRVFSIGMGPRLLGYVSGHGWWFGRLPEELLARGGTDYRLSLLPIGGYVHIAGIVDENFDAAESTAPPQPWEFRAKRTWQKALILSAGVGMNFLTAMLLFAGIALVQGQSEPATTRVGYVLPDSPAWQWGFRSGDHIRAVDGKAVMSWGELLERLTLGGVATVRRVELVRADGQPHTLEIPTADILKHLSERSSLGLLPEGTRVVVLAVETLRPAGRAGLQAQDTLLRCSGEELVAVEQLIRCVQSHAGEELRLEWKRGADTLAAVVRPDADGKIGVQIATVYAGPQRRITYSVAEALGLGVRQSLAAAAGFVNAVVHIVRGELSLRESVGGPIRIAELASQQAELGVVNFLTFLALLSVTLAVINLLPLPALDGGHLVVVLLEGLLRRELPVRFKLALQQVGVVLLVTLMVLVLLNDLRR